MKKPIKALVLFLTAIFLFSITEPAMSSTVKSKVSEKEVVVAKPVSIMENDTAKLATCAAPEVILTKSEIELVALTTMGEAEGECEYGKRLVIDTILNRVDSDAFPNTVSDVIYQPNQFECMWNGRIDRCEINDYICELVIEECTLRTNHECAFFCAGDYGVYGTPMFQVENHYFSKE